MARRVQSSKLDQAAADRQGYEARDDYDKAGAKKWGLSDDGVGEQAGLAQRIKALIAHEAYNAAAVDDDERFERHVRTALRKVAKMVKSNARVANTRLSMMAATCHPCGLVAQIMQTSVLPSCGRWPNNRVETQPPFVPTTRARDAPFGRMKTLQKFAGVRANVHNHFDFERHLVDRQTYKERSSAALAKWRRIASWSVAFKD